MENEGQEATLEAGKPAQRLLQQTESDGPGVACEWMTAVLVSWGCRNKILQTWWPK